MHTHISIHDTFQPTWTAFAHVPLNPQDVHVWQVPVTPDIPLVLSAGELARASRYHRPADALRFSATRSALRQLLQHYTGTASAAIDITTGPAGKPYIPGSPIQFSVAHSGSIALIAIAHAPVGVDVEFTNPSFAWADIARLQYSPSEQDFIDTHQHPAAAFYQLWATKEAIAKALGTNHFTDIALIPALPDNHMLSLPTPAQQWQVLPFTAQQQYTAALACPQAITAIRYLMFEN